MRQDQSGLTAQQLARRQLRRALKFHSLPNDHPDVVAAREEYYRSKRAVPEENQPDEPPTCDWVQDVVTGFGLPGAETPLEELEGILSLFAFYANRIPEQLGKRLAMVWMQRHLVLPGFTEYDSRKLVEAAMQDAQRPRTSQITNGYQFLDDTEVETLPAGKFLVQGCIPESALCVLYGPPGAGKTFLSLDIALCVGTGQPWFENEVEQGPVAYIVAEGKHGIGPRVKAWKDKYWTPGEAAGVRFIPQPVEFPQAEDVARLLADLHSWDPPPKLVVIDTLAQCLIGGDENSSRDMGLFIHGTNQLRQELGCTVLTDHHTGWEAKHERGSTALRGAADTVMRLERNDDALTLKCEKQKDGEPFPQMRFKLAPHADSCVLTRWIPTGDKLSTPALSALMALDKIALEEGASATNWMKAAGELYESRYSNRVVVPEGTFWSVRKTLVDEGYVEVVKRRYHITTSGKQAIQLYGNCTGTI